MTKKHYGFQEPILEEQVNNVIIFRAYGGDLNNGH